MPAHTRFTSVGSGDPKDHDAEAAASSDAAELEVEVDKMQLDDNQTPADKPAGESTPAAPASKDVADDVRMQRLEARMEKLAKQNEDLLKAGKYPDPPAVAPAARGAIAPAIGPACRVQLAC